MLRRSVVPVQIIKQILQGLLSALVCLEQNEILHRDIKTDNVCLVILDDFNVVPKLVDFGLAVSHRFNTVSSSSAAAAFSTAAAAFSIAAAADEEKIFALPVGMSPECIIHHEFTHKSDLWAVGIVIWELLFLACEDNVKLHPESEPVNLGARRFPFEKLGWQRHMMPYDQHQLRALIQDNLLDKFPEPHPQRLLFERICSILLQMYVSEFFVQLSHVIVFNPNLQVCF